MDNWAIGGAVASELGLVNFEQSIKDPVVSKIRFDHGLAICEYIFVPTNCEMDWYFCLLQISESKRLDESCELKSCADVYSEVSIRCRNGYLAPGIQRFRCVVIQYLIC